jgi:hypothetical protein
MKIQQTIVRLFAVGVVFVLAACSGLETGVMSASGTAAANQVSGKKPAGEAKNLPDQKEFGDVMVPREMEIDKDSSFIHNRSGANVGLLRLSGRVEARSLLRYFQNNMAADGWRMISQFRSPQSLMIFAKQNRMCVIAIEDADFQTFADVWVVPNDETVDYSPPK